MDLWLKILLISLVALAGGIVQRVTGFGFGIFSMMFIPAIIGGLYASASLLAVIFSMCLTTAIIKWNVMLPCLVGSLITTAISVAFAKGAENLLLKLILGATLISLSIYFIFFIHIGFCVVEIL